VQEAIETGAGEVRVAEAKGRKGQRGSRKKTGRTGNEEENREENSRSKESSRGMGDLGQRGEGSKIERGSKKVGAGKVSPIDKSLWKETIQENTDKEGVGPYNRGEERICAKKREDVPIVKREKRGGEGVYKGIDEEGIDMTVKVTTDGTGILCGKEG